MPVFKANLHLTFELSIVAANPEAAKAEATRRVRSGEIAVSHLAVEIDNSETENFGFAHIEVENVTDQPMRQTVAPREAAAQIGPLRDDKSPA